MDSLVLHLNTLSANDKAKDIYNLAYRDTKENRKNFEKELLDMSDNYLLREAMAAHYKQVFKITTSSKPGHWAIKLLIKYKIIGEFER